MGKYSVFIKINYKRKTCCIKRGANSGKLYLYSSGGGGHKQAMLALVQQDKDKEATLPKNYEPKKTDLMLDWLGQVGELSVKQWDEAQKKGDCKKQEDLVAKQWMGNLAFGPVIYHKLYQFLKENPNIKEIVNTQAMCNRQICQAVLQVNREDNRQISIQLYMTDLPTERAVHFWNGLKELTIIERSILTLHTLPIITKSGSMQTFLNQYCGPGIQHKITEAPIRKAFVAKGSRSRKQIDQEGFLNITWNYTDEFEAIKLYGNNITYNEQAKSAQVFLDEKTKVMSIMLGSQGGNAILDYVIQLINTYAKCASVKLILLVYCGADKNESSLIFKKTLKIIKEQNIQQQISHNLIILPLGFQNDVCIAENIKRNDLALTRTGGLASMEILACWEMNKNMHILIHSEAKDTDNVQKILEAIPVWEKGNAEYLIQKTQAKVVNIILFPNIMTEMFQLGIFASLYNSLGKLVTNYMPSTSTKRRLEVTPALTLNKNEDEDERSIKKQKTTTV